MHLSDRPLRKNSRKSLGPEGLDSPAARRRRASVSSDEALGDSYAQVDQQGVDADEVERRSPEPLQEDLYSAAIIGLIIDAGRISQAGIKSKTAKLRTARSTTTLALLTVNVFLQVFLLTQIKHFVTSKAVREIRQVYDAFEYHMYGDQENHTYLSHHGHHRGIPGYFNPKNFEIESKRGERKRRRRGGVDGAGINETDHGGNTSVRKLKGHGGAVDAHGQSGDKLVMAQMNTFNAETREQACNIPLSQPGYLLVILFIWSLTCIGEIKNAIETMFTLVNPWITKTVSSMEDSLRPGEEPNINIVVGLTPLLKLVVFAILCFRLACTCFLLWLGSRWLLATADFSDILLNAVALEFVLVLKDLLYESMVPARSQREVQNTLLLPRTELEPASVLVFLGTFLWGLLAWAWAIVYMWYLQDVLPDYQWDVSQVCDAFINKEYSP